MKTLLKTCIALLLFLPAGAQGLHAQALPFDSIAADSTVQGKYVLLLFTGSDWCANCIRLERNVLSTELFGQYLEDHGDLAVLQADFPRRGQQDAALVSRNEALAAIYNPEGLFPLVILLSPDRKDMLAIPYFTQDAATFTQQLSDLLERMKDDG